MHHNELYVRYCLISLIFSVANAFCQSPPPVLFLAARSYAADVIPSSAAVGDFNGDGKPDLAVANDGGSVRVLLGDGDGTFKAPVNYPLGLGPASVAVGDFNGDGKPDLAVANGGSNYLSVLLGNGDGTFRGIPNQCK